MFKARHAQLIGKTFLRNLALKLKVN